MRNKDLLSNLICESGIKKMKIAELLGLTPAGLISKMNGQHAFRKLEKEALVNILDIDEENERLIFERCK